jgi:hypothetical protein
VAANGHGHDRKDDHVVTRKGVGGEAEGGRDTPARHDQFGQSQAVAGEVNNCVHSIRAQGDDRGGEVHGVVDRVGGPELTHVVHLVARLRCGDDIGAPGITDRAAQPAPARPHVKMPGEVHADPETR